MPNRNGKDTLFHEQAVRVPDVRPISPPPPRFGLRSFSALSTWEGVVETLSDDGFRARLFPFEDGRPNTTRVEFADFDWEDISSDERELVTENTVFYWTLGRRRNAAGTVENVSLLRLRRLPAPSEVRQRKARAEAEDLLHSLGDDTST